MTAYKNTEVANGRPITQQGLCGVFAIALVTNLPVQRVFNKIRKMIMKDKKDDVEPMNYGGMVMPKKKKKVKAKKMMGGGKVYSRGSRKASYNAWR